MEFLEFQISFSEFFNVWNWFEKGLKIAKISIYEEIWNNLKNVKFGMEKKFLEKISKVVFHRFLGEISLKKWFFKIFAKNN